MASLLNRFNDSTYLYCISILVFAIYVYHERFGRGKRGDFQPVRRLHQSERILGLSLFKTIAASLKAGTYLKDARERFEKNGYTYSIVLAGSTMIQTAEPENLKAVLGTLQGDYDSGTVRYNSAFPLLGNGIFTSDGDYWVHSRAILKPCFTRAEIFNLQNVETHVSRLISLILRDHEAVDLRPLFFMLSLDTSTVFLLGESTNSLLSSKGMVTEGEEFANAFKFCTKELMSRVRMGRFMFLYRSKKFTEACKTCHKFADKYVQKALDQHHREKASASSGEPKAATLLDALMKETEDPIELRCQLLHLLLAGRDTTASLLSSTFFILAKRPDVWAKLRQEVLQYGDVLPTIAQIQECKYLTFVLKEVLRLYPVTVTNSRMANKNTYLPVGGGEDGLSRIFIPKGQVVAYHYHAMHRRKDIFGDDADDFRPERWETLRPRWGYLPFGGGPRICIGQRLALTEVSYTVFRFAQKFREIQSLDENEWREDISITSTAESVRVRIVPA
ncbi:cytochrome P450 [Trichoderma austrokoningii]